MKIKSPLTYSKDMYNPITLGHMKESDIRSEYSRLRDIAIKRLDRLGNSEFMDKSVADRRKLDFPKASTLDKRELTRALSDLGGFVNSAMSTITGQKNKRDRFIETMHEKGYTFLNKGNYKTFTDFIERMRPYINAQIIGSTDVLDIAQEEIEEDEEKEVTSSELENVFNQYEERAKEIAKIKKTLPQYKNANIKVEDLDRIKERISHNRKLKKQLKKANKEELKKQNKSNKKGKRKGKR